MTIRTVHCPHCGTDVENGWGWFRSAHEMPARGLELGVPYFRCPRCRQQILSNRHEWDMMNGFERAWIFLRLILVAPFLGLFLGLIILAVSNDLPSREPLGARPAARAAGQAKDGMLLAFVALSSVGLALSWVFLAFKIRSSKRRVRRDGV